MSQDQEFKEKGINVDSFAGKFRFGAIATLTTNQVHRCCHAISSIRFRWISLEINVIYRKNNTSNNITRNRRYWLFTPAGGLYTATSG